MLPPPRPEMDAPTREMIVPSEEVALTVNETACTNILAEGGGVIRTPYNYEYSVVFKDQAAVNAFHQRPSLNKDIETIKQTVRAGMDDTLKHENSRDVNNYFDGVPFDEKAIKGINPGTEGDIKQVMSDATKIFQQEFPDAGIKEVRMEKIEGGMDYCRQPGPADWYEPIQTGDAGPATPDAAPIQQASMAARPMSLGL